MLDQFASQRRLLLAICCASVHRLVESFAFNFFPTFFVGNAGCSRWCCCCATAVKIRNYLCVARSCSLGWFFFFVGFIWICFLKFSNLFQEFFMPKLLKNLTISCTKPALLTLMLYPLSFGNIVNKWRIHFGRLFHVFLASLLYFFERCKSDAYFALFLELHVILNYIQFSLDNQQTPWQPGSTITSAHILTGTKLSDHI